MIRREIEFSGKRQFCALNVELPDRLHGSDGWAVTAGKISVHLKTSLRNAHSGIRRGTGDFTMFLPNSGVKECAKGAAVIQAALRAQAGLTEVEAARSICAFVYPEDFTNEEDFVEKVLRDRKRGEE
jgi:hypothetical protein